MDPQDKRQAMILGALVADAAAMGLHWVYDQGHLATLAPDTPEFRTPDAADYDGVMGFFAHPGRTAGEQSQYGEQALVMLRCLAAQGWRYDTAAFAAAFRAHFGYGGAYVGYIDHATRGTLDNYRRFDDAATAVAHALPFEGEARERKALLAKALPLLERHKGAALTDAFAQSAAEVSSDAAVTTFARSLIEALRDLPLPCGAHDLQLPAIAKLPPLVALLGGGGALEAAVDAAVRSTSDHPTAAVYGRISARMMATALTYQTGEEVVAEAVAQAPDEARASLQDALARRAEGNSAVTAHFGMACDLPMGVPSAAHNIATAASYSQAVRNNILAGGDNCGRAMLVGAVMGALHGIGGESGIPQAWIDRLAARDEVAALLDEMPAQS